MAQSLHVVGVHLVFGTRCPRPMLDSTVRPGLFNYVAGILHNLERRAVMLGGVEDHVLIACLLTKGGARSRKSHTHELKETTTQQRGPGKEGER